MGEIVLMLLIIGLLPASIAALKGRSFWGWYIYGVFWFAIALVHVLFVKKDEGFIKRQYATQGLKECESCREYINSQAKVCRFCRSEVEPSGFIDKGFYASKNWRRLMFFLALVSVIYIVTYVVYNLYFYY